ncbi:bifunctional NAD(P)H-hydrate repair enzyme Nnr [Clostridium pasteurianum DSM 525 = ATCC 6013]|uniref:Bifunctional NAD(P)H-hydrate repair enzyme n=1 Tax=Clostridium pasteurianum DSM 525 = ATCC 6013 TaxID=1262449 RepID=A0A0H3JAU1_CLOPA|nr:NAD(P)H-hydrate dehydratase [Clostridium pasteurianum]AJA48860.1 bifunctional NAD(P)H-hydrate repair enzyme Nnr [Clostridium pasteurianum DSM 525 = ATCC 6013]AJA52848.1 bifunctional NAD(P)H-hydrate repair enzyme Nnr [Clostridium pasteurianum DSM 525 = ATCC 6013]AOZ76072.1 carbohydrate kinase [Clostridium pasteurianum DSM 525 = ATCC 6013]AOZ79868.1 carbohydrate kinase [Clostridium pasteurianum]ELP60156.1 hypothetical protein F502_05952 [Clostridium pasteurianum DSM 525 = ATCC 6013]
MKFVSSNIIKKIDNYCINELGISELVLMENAALKVIKNIDLKDNSYFTVICGTGNNGGDGFAVARHLISLKKNVQVFFVGNVEKMTDSCRANYSILKNMEVNIIFIQDLKDIEHLEVYLVYSDVIIDALLGTGINRNVEGIYDTVISTINENSQFTVSIDVPSGLNSDTGDVMGNCIDSNKTITFELYKSGFLNYNSEKYTGEIIVEKIGIPEFVISEFHDGGFVTDKDIFKKKVAVRDKYSHKGNYGRVLIFAGSEQYTGAAYISTEGAVRSGAGLVTLCCDEDILQTLRSKFNEAMTISSKNIEGVNKLLANSNCVAVGPGMGDNENTYKVLNFVLKNSKCPVVIDADGINVLSKDLSILENSKVPVLITPHPGEMSRLTGLPVDYIEKNRIKVAKEFAKKYNVIVLLKGYNTVITKGNSVIVNSTGNSAMASGGMGDCLTGIITSFIAQGQDVIDAAVTGAFLHGYCGEMLSKEMFNVSASDVLDAIPYAIKKLQN